MVSRRLALSLSVALTPAAAFVACIGEVEPITIGLDGGPEGGGATSSSSSGAIGVAETGAPSTNDGGPKEEAGPTPVRDAEPDAPPPRKRIFVTTSGAFTGNLGGLAGADRRCQEAADAAGTGGQFQAYLSVPGASAVDRLAGAGPWYSMDRETLIFTGKATGAAPLKGLGPLAPIAQNELGQTFTNETYFWTGTLQGGTPSNDHCDTWTYDGMVVKGGTAGRTGATDKLWTEGTPYVCYAMLHLVCFEK
jgi:hypothetical protein